MSQNSTALDIRQSIRQKIRPYSGSSPEKRTFPVSWSDSPQTFEQITDALRPQIVKDLLYLKKVARQYIGDLVQQGWLRLWQALQENANFLTELTALKAADFVTNRCGATTLHDYLKRYDSYHHLSKWNDTDADVYEEGITEIVIGSSLKSTGKPGHALFTRKVDVFVDIERALGEVAAWCGDKLEKLAALYYLTTSVNQVDAGRIAGLEVRQRSGRIRCPKMGHWTQVVLKRLKAAFASYMPIEPNKHYWREQIKAGVLEPVVELAEKYAEDAQKLLALYVLTSSVGRETIVKECGVDDSALWYAVKQVRQDLRCIYARRVCATAV